MGGGSYLKNPFRSYPHSDRMEGLTMAQLRNTTINGTLSLNAYSGIADVEKYLMSLQSQVSEIKTTLDTKSGYPDYSSSKVIITAVKEGSATISEDGFIIMSILASSTTSAWYLKINGYDVMRYTEFGSGAQNNKFVQGPYPVKKGDIVSVFGGINLLNDDAGTAGIIFFKSKS